MIYANDPKTILICCTPTFENLIMLLCEVIKSKNLIQEKKLRFPPTQQFNTDIYSNSTLHNIYKVIRALKEKCKMESYPYT